MRKFFSGSCIIYSLFSNAIYKSAIVHRSMVFQNSVNLLLKTVLLEYADHQIAISCVIKCDCYIRVLDLSKQMHRAIIIIMSFHVYFPKCAICYHNYQIHFLQAFKIALQTLTYTYQPPNHKRMP